MKKNIEFPDCWEELHPSEWVFLLKLRDRMANDSRVSLLDVKRTWCRYVLKRRGIKPWRHKTDFLLLVDRLASTLDWQWLVEDNTVALAFDSTVNLLPSWSVFHGPASHGADLTFGEFRYAVNLMNQYTSTHDAGALDNLCAVLYRELDCMGRRIPFTQDVMLQFSPSFSAMPGYLKWGVYSWFASFCDFLFNGTFIIDGSEICFAPVFKGGGSGPQPDQSIGLNSILFSVAESGVFGNIEDVDNTQLMRVLLKLLDDKQKADSLLKSIKK